MPVVTPGKVILTNEPFIYAANLNLKDKNICDTCLKSEKKLNPSQLRRCNGCHVVWYCGKTCQAKAWNEFHKYECKGLKKLATQKSGAVIPVEPIRLLVRALVKLHDGKDYFDEVETSAGKVQRRFNDLLSHFENFAMDFETMNSCMMMVQAAEIIMEETSKIKIYLSPADRMKIIGRIQINNFGIPDEDEGDGAAIGAAVYLAGSIFNHSCNPHAIQSFQGTKLIVRNIRDIPEGLPLDKVTVSYIDTLQLSEQRREKLSDYYFLCQCELCKTGVFDKEMRSIICSKEGCNAEIDIDELVKGIPCQACGHRFAKDVERIVQVENVMTKLKKNNFVDMPPDPERYLSIFKKLNFSDANWVMIQMYEMCLAVALSERNYEKAYQYGLKRVEGMRRYLNPNNPILGWLLVKLAEVSLLRKNFDDAEQMINEARAILMISIGEEALSFKSRINPVVEKIEEAKAKFATKMLESRLGKMKL